MTVIQLYGVLSRYGVDVLILALGVTLLVSLLKKTVMRQVKKKVFVFLPFGLGILLYGLYSLIGGGSGTGAVVTVLGRGLSTGCAATLYYVFYEQFLRGKLSADPLLPLLACVPEDRRAEASAALTSAYREAEEEDKIAAVAERLASFADPPLSDAELALTAGLVKEYLSSLA